MKTVRTMLYGDCEFEPWELELLHTPIMQRMYNLKQLGFADKVYPDAVHSRFNHFLGVTTRADRIVAGVIRSLDIELNQHNPPARTAFDYGEDRIPIGDLRAHVASRRPVVRLIALLHDIGHIPFSHTLEDEMHVFSVKHDNPKRQCQFFNILVRELIYSIILRHDPNLDPALLPIVCKDEPSDVECNRLIASFKATIDRISKFYEPTLSKKIHAFLIDLQRAMVSLFYLDDVHKEKNGSESQQEQERARQQAMGELFITVVLSECGITPLDHQPEFSLNLDAFTLDIIGNTICADLLDYAKRDSRMAGLHYDYDDRIFKYFSLVSYKGKGTAHHMIRLCLQVFTNKLRLDVVSEIVTILRARYLLSERVIFHPTKCAVGAMLGTAVYMMGIQKAELNFFRIGDAVFLAKLEDHVCRCLRVASEIQEFTAVDDAAHRGESIKLLTLSKDPGRLEDFAHALTAVSATFKISADQPSLTSSLLKICSEELKYIEAHNDGELFADAEAGQALAKRIVLRLTAASHLMWQVQARQFYDLVFRIARIDTKATAKVVNDLASKFRNPVLRFEFERRIEEDADLPYGSLVIHCPKFDTSLKEAKVLVFGFDPKTAIEFSAIDEKHELYSLNPHIREAVDIASAYERIWNMYFFVQEAQMYKWPLIEERIRLALKKVTNFEIANCNDLHRQLKTVYADVAKQLIDVVEFMESSEDGIKVPLTREFAKFVEMTAPSGKRSDITPKMLVDQWALIKLRPSEKSEKK